MAHTAVEFLAIIKPMVIKDMAKSKILASLTAAQALIESNKGNSELAVKGNNLFGIKGNYEGQYVMMPTKEWAKDRGYYTIEAQFRKYPSWQESIADHSALFNRANRYANLRGETDYKTACKNVQKDGYATSPTYSNTLIKTIETYKLYEWDREAMGEKLISDAESIDNHPKTGNPYAEPTKNVRYGSSGNEVRWVQYQLNLYGYGLLIDGAAGEQTIAALKNYQYNHRLLCDGICGPVTRKALAGR